MAFGFPAYHTEGFSSNGVAPDMRAAVRKALKRLYWTLREEEVDGGIVASTGIGLQSSGEHVFIAFDSESSVSITSKCSSPTRCIDWGKNKINVARFKQELAKHA